MTIDHAAARAGADALRARVEKLAARRQQLTEDRVMYRQRLRQTEDDIDRTDTEIGQLMAVIAALDPQPGQEAA